MINTETSKVSYKTVADASAAYPIPFKFDENPATEKPELSVILNGTALTAGIDYRLTDAGLVLTKAPEAGENLVIDRNIALTQEQDFQTGYIDPEQVEHGFDRSVMRDQMLSDRIAENEEDITNLTQEVEEARDIAQEALATANSAEQTATQAAKDAADAKAAAAAADEKAQNALDSVGQFDERITKNTQDIATNAAAIADAQTTADSAFAKANKNAEDITVLKQDQMDLGDQVHEIEAKIPGDASTTNLLVTKKDLADIDVLPSQTGNAGKFLTTNGTDASWAEVKQGGGIEWFKEFTYTKGEADTGPVQLRFSIPFDSLVVGHVYEFYMASYGLPYFDSEYTEKTRYVRFTLNEGGAIGGIAYLAQVYEQAYSGNVDSKNDVLLYVLYRTTDDKIVFVPTAWEGCAESIEYGNVGATLKTNCITKIHDVTADSYIEPQDLEQVVGWDAINVPPTDGYKYTQIMRQRLLQVPQLLWGDATTQNGNFVGVSISGFYTSAFGWVNYESVCVVSIVERNTANQNNGVGMYVFQLVPAGVENQMSVLELHRSGTFSNRRIVVGRNDDDRSQLIVSFADKNSFNSDPVNNEIYIATMWYGNFDQTAPHSISNIYSTNVPATEVQFITDSIYSGATGDYVEKDQGADNAGKFLKVGPDGQVIASAESAGGGLLAVAHDDTLAGSGTDADPLRVVGGGSSTDNNGLEGDYCSRYGIVDETTSGLPTIGTGNQVIIPAGLVLDVPGSPGLTTVGSQIVHDLTATTNCELWLANGNVIEVLDMFWSEEEPEDGTEGFAGWWNGSEMKFKSNDTGNVWRGANAARVAKCVFTDGNLTRLCFTGCRLLNKQEFVPLHTSLKFAQSGDVVIAENRMSGPYAAKIGFRNNGREFWFSDYFGGRWVMNYEGFAGPAGLNLGSSSSHWAIAYVNKLNNGADITVPTTGGTIALTSDIPDISTLATKTELATKQDALSTEQLAAANSTITAEKVSAYDGYAALITAKANQSEVDSLTADVAALQADKADKSEIPDVSGFQTAAQVTTIATNTTNGIIADRFQVVDALPESPDANTFYFVKKAA